MLGIFADEVFKHLARTAGEQGVVEGKAGSVTFVQRADSAIRINVHFHMVALDGVYVDDGSGRPRFHEVRAPDREELEEVVSNVARRVRKVLSRRGLGDEPCEAAEEPDALSQCLEHAQRKLPLASIDDEGAVRPARPDPWERYLAALSSESKLAAQVDGFNLHAGVRVEADDEKGRELLLRYGARPPFSLSRLSEAKDGRLLYALKKPRKNGQTHLVLTPLELLARLSAMIPPPYVHAVRFHGVLAAASRLRKAVVPAPPASRKRCAGGHADTGVPAEDEKTQANARIPWAELLERIYGVDALECPGCKGRLAWLALIPSPEPIRRILTHLGLPAERPRVAPARDPP